MQRIHLTNSRFKNVFCINGFICHLVLEIVHLKNVFVEYSVEQLKRPINECFLFLFYLLQLIFSSFLW